MRIERLGYGYPAIAVLLVMAALLSGCGTAKRLPPVTGGEAPPAPDRKGPGPVLLAVGLIENEAKLTVAALGHAFLVDGTSGARLGRYEPGAGTLVCTRDGGQVSWRHGRLSGRTSSLLLQPVDPSHRVTWSDGEYRGDFLVRPSPQQGGLTLVNNLALEAYLQGVVPWEIGRHGDAENAAVQAQAVAARTYTVSHLGARRDRGFDLFASVMDQVYRGAKDEDPGCNAAIVATAGLVLRHDGREIEAYYSACCGGVSSRVEEVWPRGGAAYLVSHRDSPQDGGPDFCAESKYYHWRETWSAERLEEILQETLPAYLDYMAQGERAAWSRPTFTPRDGSGNPNRPGALRGLEILDYTSSGRVAHLAVSMDAGTYHVRGDRNRWVLPPASGNPFILRSAMFELEIVRRDGRLSEVSARGRGFGHGIGLCQTGALEMSRQGYSFKEILAHYYPGAVLQTPR